MGTFLLDSVRPGRTQLDGSAPGGIVDGKEVLLEDHVSGVVLRAIGGEVRAAGFLRDCLTSEPIGGAGIAICLLSGGRIILSSSSASVGDRGPEGMARGQFRLSMWARMAAEQGAEELLLGFAAHEYEPKILEFPPWDPRLDSVEDCLEPLRAGHGSLAGTLLFDDGSAYSGPFELHVLRPEPGASVMREAVSTLEADRGFFHLGNLLPGDLVAWPSIPERVPLEWAIARRIHIDPDRKVSVEWVLPRGGDVRVEARDPTGNMLAEFHARLAGSVGAFTEKGREGVALFRQVPEGEYRVTVAWPRVGERESSVVVRQNAEAVVMIAFDSAAPRR